MYEVENGMSFSVLDHTEFNGTKLMNNWFVYTKRILILKVLYPGDNAKRRVTPNDLLKNILNKIDEEMLGNNIDKKYDHNEFDKNDTIMKGINHYNNVN